MKLWKRASRTGGAESSTVGIVLGASRATVVACDGETNGRPQVLAWESLDSRSTADFQASLQLFVAAQGLQGRDCRCVLSPEDYSLRLVERPPNVPDEELADATRWLIRDLIEFDVESAELAILPIPDPTTRARVPCMFVVAARHEPLRDLADAIESAGLHLTGFEIIETAMLALEARMPEVVAGSAVVRVEEKASIVTLSQAGQLYLARNLNLDFDSIEVVAQHASTAEDPASFEILQDLDPLLLDVQRSLDYYEGEYGLAPASRLVMMPSGADLASLIPALSEALRPMQVESFDLDGYFDFIEPPPSNIHPDLALATAAAVGSGDALGDALVPSVFKARQGGLGIPIFAQIAALVALVLGSYAGISRFELSRERADLAVRESAVAGLEMQIETLRRQAIERANQLDPTTRLESLRAERDARLGMLRDIGARKLDSASSFSGLLVGLARQDLEGVWLERIAFADAGASITLEGRALDAEDVPRFLRRIGTESLYSARRFRTFQISEAGDTTPGLPFRISTEDDR